MAQRSIEEGTGLFGPDSVIWRVNRETVVALAGTCATLMQVAHPAVAAGVRDHSHYEIDLAGRLRRTMDLTMAMVFGSHHTAERAARVINARHREVRGQGYAALDPELLLWVQATLVYAAVRAYPALVGPMSAAEADAYYQDTKKIGVLLGVPPAIYPGNLDALEAYMVEMIEAGPVRVGGDALRIARLLLYPRFRGVPPIAFAPVRTLTAGLLPHRLRDAYGLAWTPRQQRAFGVYCALSRRLIRLLPGPVRHMPRARQAYRRLQLQPA